MGRWPSNGLPVTDLRSAYYPVVARSAQLLPPAAIWVASNCSSKVVEHLGEGLVLETSGFSGSYSPLQPRRPLRTESGHQRGVDDLRIPIAGQTPRDEFADYDAIKWRPRRLLKSRMVNSSGRRFRFIVMNVFMPRA